MLDITEAAPADVSPVMQEFMTRRQNAVALWKDRVGSMNMSDWSSCALGQLARANVAGWSTVDDSILPAFTPSLPPATGIINRIKRYFSLVRPQPVIIGFDAGQMYFGLPAGYSQTLFGGSSDVNTLEERLMAAPYA